MRLPTQESFSVTCWLKNDVGWDHRNPPSFQPCTLVVQDGRIADIAFHDTTPRGFSGLVGCPGGVNAHVHAESNTVTLLQSAPEYARCGETLLVTDFHEAANAGGIDYVLWNIFQGTKTPLRYAHGAPSSVPSDPRFEQVGTEQFGPEQIEQLFDNGCSHLSEVMAYMPYIHGARFVRDIVDVAVARRKPADGHAVKLSATEAAAYFEGLRISTNHECTQLDEALAQARLGAKIWIRRGSAANDFDALHPLLLEHPERCGFCTDDLHPDGLIAGRGTFSMVRDAALQHRIPLLNVVHAWSYVPRLHYGVGGVLRVGDPADLVLLDTDSISSPSRLSVKGSYVGGRLIAEDGEALFPPAVPGIDGMDSTWRRRRPVRADELKLPARGSTALVLNVRQGSLIKTLEPAEITVVDGMVAADLHKDIAKVGALNRYTTDAAPSVMLLRGFGVKKRFAIVSSVSHDRHSPIYLGTDDDFIAKALNMVIREKGGLAVLSEDHCELLPLPICGLMSNLPIAAVAERYATMERIVSRNLTDGSMTTPLMMLSFIGLIVIPDGGVGDDAMYRMTAGGPERLTSIFI